MIEILILSLLGFAGTAIGGLVSGDDDDASENDDAETSADGDVGSDLLLGTDHADVMDGTDAGDQIFLDAGDDVSEGGAGDDSIPGGDGLDSIAGEDGDDTLHGGQMDDVLTDWDGSNEMYGEVDQAYGGDGNDQLNIRGATEAYGGECEDTFTSYYNTWVEEAPTVMDFDASEGQLEVGIYSHEGQQDLDDFEITVQDFEDGSGASIYVDGIEVMRVPGAQGLDLADVQLNLV